MTQLLSKLYVTFLLTQTLAWGGVTPVTNLLDFGAGSLRNALDIAQNNDQIIFDSSLQGTLLLLSPLPSINADLEIIGPSSNGINISGNALFPIFDVGTNVKVSMSNLNIINGSKAGSGAGLSVGNGSTASISNISFSNCDATGAEGGAVHVGSSSLLKAFEVSFSNNSSGGPGDDIFLNNSSVLQYDCTGTISAIELFGTGSVFKSGTGQVTFTIPSSTPLALIVQDGEVISTGVRTEPSIVYGSLEGSQTTLYFTNHGTFKPSETIGASTITEDYSQASSATLEITISPSTNDFIQIGGNAYLHGTLSILPEQGIYTIGNTYTILTTIGKINSPFDSVVSSSMSFNVLYFNNRVDIQITSL